jgi:signal transduction histidine kinase
MKLRTKLAVGLVALTLVLSLATYGGMEFYKEQQVERVKSDVNRTAGLATAQVRSDIDSYRDDLAFAAGQVDGANLTSARDRVGTYLEQSRFFATYVVNDNATIVQAFGPFNDSEREDLIGTRATIDCVNETLDTGDACVSEVRTPDGGTPYVVMTAPVFHEGEVTGALAAPIHVGSETFFGSLSMLATETQSIRVYHGDRLLYEAGGSFRGSVAVAREVPGPEIRILVERDRSRLTAELQNLAVVEALGIFLVALVVTLLGYWEYSVNLSQTARLLDGFQAIERGEYDYELSLSASEEWEQISDGFAALASTLAARNAALDEREQRLEVLNRVMRHNVRNEMTVVLSYTEMLADSLSGEQADRATTAAEAGYRLTDLVDQARRIENTLSDGASEPEPVDLAAITRTVGSNVARSYPNVSFHVDLPEHCWIHGVEELAEGVEELLTNACKHSDASDPRVSVTIEDRAVDGGDALAEATVHLRVADNGSGIPEHERGAIEQGKETALEHSSGLGLWLVRWLVDRCDGTLDFGESKAGGAVVDCGFRPATAEEQPGASSLADQ